MYIERFVSGTAGAEVPRYEPQGNSGMIEVSVLRGEN